MNKGFGYIMYRDLTAVDNAINMLNGTFLAESDVNKPLIVQKSLCNTIMMIYGLSKYNNTKQFIRKVRILFNYKSSVLLITFSLFSGNKRFCDQSSNTFVEV